MNHKAELTKSTIKVSRARKADGRRSPAKRAGLLGGLGVKDIESGGSKEGSPSRRFYASRNYWLHSCELYSLRSWPLYARIVELMANEGVELLSLEQVASLL